MIHEVVEGHLEVGGEEPKMHFINPKAIPERAKFRIIADKLMREVKS